MQKRFRNDNWFGSWLNAAKDKSSKVLEFVKKDLEEFSNAVKNEASNVVSTTGNVIEKTLKLDSPDSTASSMKRSFSSFLGQMNTALNPSPDDSDAEAILIGEDSETSPLTKLQKALYDLQKNDATFLEDFDGELEEKFKCWLEITDEEQFHKDKIDKHLDRSSVLREHYLKLVPEVVPYGTFWRRYLFKKALLEDEIAREEVAEKRERKSEGEVKWDKEEFAHYIELTEEEQIKLLEEYESEIKQVNENCKVKSPKKLGKIESNKSLDTNSSNSSTDGDWEKISDVDK